ncbi:DUF6415 family natural product biosynthesis protein [Streptomyces kronopolitis]|uniref:DUF6415 family natural product biosynthesis protein n=1 Tax=Streptomyces kronopolitis TaxID=1612435 RepID=UPI003D9638D9
MSLVRVRSGRCRASSADASRSVVSAAQETVSMVLADGAPTPESDQDIRDLMLMLRGHLMLLGALTPDQSSAAAKALEVSDGSRACARRPWNGTRIRPPPDMGA